MKAFPTTAQSWDMYNGKDLSGMDLRDYFAAMVMQGIVLNESSHDPLGDPLFVEEDPVTFEGALECYAVAAYRMADVMMKVRKQNEPS